MANMISALLIIALTAWTQAVPTFVSKGPAEKAPYNVTVPTIVPKRPVEEEPHNVTGTAKIVDESATKAAVESPGTDLSAGDYLKGLQDKIDGMTKKITGLTEQMDGLKDLKLKDELSVDTNYIYFPKGTKKRIAKKFYNVYDYVFVGYGYRTHYDDETKYTTATVKECIEKCFTLRQGDVTWNGVYYYDGNNECRCQKNESGHSENDKSLHYKHFPVS